MHVHVYLWKMWAYLHTMLHFHNYHNYSTRLRWSLVDYMFTYQYWVLVLVLIGLSTVKALSLCSLDMLTDNFDTTFLDCPVNCRLILSCPCMSRCDSETCKTTENSYLRLDWSCLVVEALRQGCNPGESSSDWDWNLRPSNCQSKHTSSLPGSFRHCFGVHVHIHNSQCL